jgi:predicted outer membrane repeat protein
MLRLRFLALPLLCLPVRAADILVPADFPTIQQAINAAGNFDTIRVSPGTYPERLDFLGKALTLESTNPANPSIVAATILDGGLDLQNPQFPQGEEHALVIRNVSAGPAIVRGLTFQRYGDELGYVPGIEATNNLAVLLSDCRFLDFISVGGAGGAVEIRGNASITGCLFERCDSTGGSSGAIAVLSGNVQVASCNFVDNEGAEGGAVGYTGSSSSGSVSGSQFNGNNGQRGGCVGAVNGASVTVSNCNFDQNTANGGTGGALAVKDAVLGVEDCTFTGNQAIGGSGGAISVEGTGNLTAVRCQIRSNVASGGTGGGLSVRNAGQANVIDSVFFGNSTPSGGGLAINLDNTAGLTLDRCTVAGNSGTAPAVRANGSSVLNASSSIVFNHSSNVVKAALATTNFSYCNIQGGQPGVGNLNANPLFVNLASGDLRLSPGSPSIDTGNPSLAITGKDLDGDPRILDGDLNASLLLDQGADEFAPLRLAVTGTFGAGNTISINTTPNGASFLAGILIVGVQPSELLLVPLGILFSNPLSATIINWPTPPAAVPFTLSASLPAGVFVSLQAVGIALGAFTISNPVELISQ